MSRAARGLIHAGLIVVVGVIAYLYGPTVMDMYRASRFEPSSRIAQVTQRIGLTGTGKRLFYASYPVIQGQGDFNESCQSGERTAAILGCYAQRRVYLYNINNPDLDGAVEVTAAHELLHAAYARLTFFEKAQVDKLIDAEYQKHKTDPTIAGEMEYYKTAEPGEERNELHSIIGTTIADLPPALESYYVRYFTDRQSIVALNTAYTVVFDKLEADAKALEARMKRSAAEIRTESDAYNRDLSRLNGDIDVFNRRAAQGDFSSQYAFTVERRQIVARSSALTDRQVALNHKIDAYNADVAAYSKLTLRAKQLNESINGVEAPGEL